MQFDRCRLNWNMGHRRRDGNNIRSFMCFVWCRLSTRCHFQSFTPVIVHERQNQTKKKTRAMIQNVNDKWQLAWDLGIKWPLNITAICGFIKNRNDCRCRLENSWKKIHMPPNTHTHTNTGTSFWRNYEWKTVRSNLHKISRIYDERHSIQMEWRAGLSWCIVRSVVATI